MRQDIGCYELANHLRAAAAIYHDDGMAIRKQMENPDSVASKHGLRRALEQFETQFNRCNELATALETSGPCAIRVIDA